MELTQGSRFAGRFKIIGCLGTGYHGPVFLAKDGEKNDSTVALKVFNEGALGSKEDRAQIRMGFNSLHAIQCDSLAKPLEYVEQNALRAVAMEYVEGRDLGTLLEEVNPTTDEVVRLIIDIAKILRQLHLSGYVHGEITPAHVIVTPERDLKLCGCPQPAESKANGAYPLSLRLGAAHYYSPEFLSSGVFDVQSDIYSLGVLGCELLGRAWNGGDRIRKKAKKRLLQIMGKAMDRDPNSRYQNADDFIEALEDMYRFPPRAFNGTLFVVLILAYHLLLLWGLYLLSENRIVG